MSDWPKGRIVDEGAQYSWAEAALVRMRPLQ